MNFQKIYYLYLESMLMMRNSVARSGMAFHELSQDFVSKHIPVKGGENGGHDQSGLREIGFNVWFNGKENTA
jgi:hypothetical protein